MIGTAGIKAVGGMLDNGRGNLQRRRVGCGMISHTNWIKVRSGKKQI